MRDIIPRDRVTLSRCRNEKRERESSANLASAREQTDQEQTRGNTAERVKRPEPSTSGWTNRGHKESRTKSISVDRVSPRRRPPTRRRRQHRRRPRRCLRRSESSNRDFKLLVRARNIQMCATTVEIFVEMDGERFRKCRQKRRVRQSRSCRLSWHQSTSDTPKKIQVKV